MKIQIFSRYTRPLVSGCKFLKPSKTSQEFKDDCNVNKLLLRYTTQARLLGVPVSEVLPKLDSEAFRDVSNVEDFQTSMNRIAQLKDVFGACPSDVRRKYGDDLETFVSALQNPNEFEYLADHGVLKHEQVKQFFDIYGRETNSTQTTSQQQSAEVKQTETQSEV